MLAITSISKGLAIWHLKWIYTNESLKPVKKSTLLCLSPYHGQIINSSVNKTIGVQRQDHRLPPVYRNLMIYG